jgi:HSP20 family protein
MAEPTKLPVKTEKSSAPSPWRPFEHLRREIDRLFDDFNGGFWRPSFPRSFFDVAPLGRGEETQKDYHLQERSYGSFQRTFQVPNGVDTNRIEADFKNGVLTLNLPKSAEAQKATKKIEVKAA